MGLRSFLVFMAANSNLLKNIDPDFMGYEDVIVYHFRHARLKYATIFNMLVAYLSLAWRK